MSLLRSEPLLTQHLYLKQINDDNKRNDVISCDSCGTRPNKVSYGARPKTFVLTLILFLNQLPLILEIILCNVCV
jgi:hypothetical protein